MLRWVLFLLSLFSLIGFKPKSCLPKLHRVEIKEMKFWPMEIQVKKGDTIIWINRDMVPHNVTEEKRKAWASPVLKTGKSWKMIARESAQYFCSLHPVMKGKIQVK